MSSARIFPVPFLKFRCADCVFTSPRNSRKRLRLILRNSFCCKWASQFYSRNNKTSEIEKKWRIQKNCTNIYRCNNSNNSNNSKLHNNESFLCSQQKKLSSNFTEKRKKLP